MLIRDLIGIAVSGPNRYSLADERVLITQPRHHYGKDHRKQEEARTPPEHGLPSGEQYLSSYIETEIASA